MIERISPAAFALIVQFETGGRDYYENFYKSRPCWPGGSSGVTIGAGYDLGYEQSFVADWQAYLAVDVITRLERCLGKTGSQGKQAMSGVRDIEVPWDFALEVFNNRSLPGEIHKTLATFPLAANRLSADAFGALVSLVFNRGTDLDGPRRAEMAAIRELILDVAVGASSPEAPDAALHLKIAAEFRSMKRLWSDDPESDGDLVDRREAEAKLVEACAV